MGDGLIEIVTMLRDNKTMCDPYNAEAIGRDVSHMGRGVDNTDTLKELGSHMSIRLKSLEATHRQTLRNTGPP